MNILREFLESSTIHGLSYISTSKVTFCDFLLLIHAFDVFSLFCLLLLFLSDEDTPTFFWNCLVQGILEKSKHIGNSKNCQYFHESLRYS